MTKKIPRELLVSDKNTFFIEDNARPPELLTSIEFSNAVSSVYGNIVVTSHQEKLKLLSLVWSHTIQQKRDVIIVQLNIEP